MTRELPHARPGVPVTGLGRGLAALAVGVLSLSLCLGSAQADDLTDRRDELQQQAEQTKRDLSESTEGLNDAVAALAAAESELGAAEAALAETQRQVAEARALDEQMQQELAAAEEALEQARIEVAENQRELDEQQLLVGEVVRSEYQQRTNLMGVAVLLQTESQSDLQTKMQWSTTMFDTTESGMDDLRRLQEELEAAEQRRVEIEAQVAADRRAAAENLQTKAALEAQAEEQRAAVDALVQRSAAARADAEHQVDADEERYQQLVSERDAVEQRIAERVAAAKAKAEREKAERERAEREAAARAEAEREAAARAEAEREAEQEAEQERRAEGERSSQRQEQTSSRTSQAAPAPAAEPEPDTSFAMPVSGPITSRYGMRVHPVTGVYKLHDGTDFGVGCGTPIRAPYSGTVSEQYFNAGYGNRLLIDHGSVGGRYVTTVMNHATSYTVGVGERVSKGQVVGYVGSTGYSTGCHLHLMTYVDGSMADPMRTGLF